MRISIATLAALLGALAATAAQPGAQRSWWPQQIGVARTPTSVTVSTRYYTFEHDLTRGGAIARIHLTHGRAANLLASPIEAGVQLASPPGELASEREAMTKLTFSDLNDRSPSVSHSSPGETVTVTVEASLLDPNGKPSGLRTKTTYSYRWGYVRIRKELTVGAQPIRARHFKVLGTVLDPSLSDYGYRPGIRELMDPELFSWRAGQIRRWGKIRAGTHFDLPLRTRQLPRYAVFANQGVEGIEWFAADDLYQWDYQMTGQPGTGHFEAGASTEPLGVAVSIFPVNLSTRYEPPKGGNAPLRGSYTFDYYLGVPLLEGHAWNPWLNKSYAVNRGAWVSEEQIRKNAEDGIVTMHLHNDGDAHGDGLFWRDGSYPPYPPAEMKKMDQVIAAIHRHGMKTAPYFSHHELHQSTEEFKKHGREWGRIVDDQENLRPNYYYGAHMCLKSGWLDFLKFSIDRVLKNHAFDGTYYDWNIAMFCNNPLHMGRTSNGVSGEKGLGAIAISETAHWDIDELIDLVEWTRRRVGPDGIMILHNTLVPMFATENFANYVVGMEFSYGKLSVSVPPPGELPLEWDFVGARPRAVIGYGTIARDAPKRLHRQHAIATLMTSVAPWPASEEAIELYKILKPLGNLEQYRFEDYRNQAVLLDDRGCTSAIYSGPGESYALLANREAEPKTVSVKIRSNKLPHSLARLTTAEILRDGKPQRLDPSRLAGSGERIELAGDGVLLLHLK
jgi:hypothetical protein